MSVCLVVRISVEGKLKMCAAHVPKCISLAFGDSFGAQSTKDVVIYPTHCFNRAHQNGSCLELILLRSLLMELWQLRTFRMVSETLNFTSAAKELNLTQ